MTNIDFEKYIRKLNVAETLRYYGRVKKIAGLGIEATGPKAEVGEICKILKYPLRDDILAEVVGFNDDKIMLMPYGDTGGIKPGDKVVSTGNQLTVTVGRQLIGKVLDGLGNPIDGSNPEMFEKRPLHAPAPNPYSRKRITEPLSLGIKPLDTLLTCGKGQRLGIFSGTGVGKSTLLGMIARNSSAEINVIVLVGERGREVNDFLERDLKKEGLEKSVVIVATSDQPALIRVKAALTGTTIAEYFRDQGKSVLLMMDSLTRFAIAQRDVGLSVGELPVARGYTPSVFSMLPKLIERTGWNDRGYITAIYTVLVEGDEMNEPISDAVRGILDGHVLLSRSLASENHFPAIDILNSISRVMPDIVTPEHRLKAGEIRNLMAVYENYKDLISIGAYKKGSAGEIDRAISHIGKIKSFLRQNVDEHYPLKESVGTLYGLIDS